MLYLRVNASEANVHAVKSLLILVVFSTTDSFLMSAVCGA